MAASSLLLLSLNLGFLTDSPDPRDCGRNDTRSSETPKLLPGSPETLGGPSHLESTNPWPRGFFKRAPGVPTGALLSPVFQ